MAPAQEDICAILQYALEIEQDIEYVEKLYENLRNPVKRLATFPFSGRMSQIEGIRELLVKDLPYTIHYCVTQDAVQILRVMHTARKWMQ